LESITDDGGLYIMATVTTKERTFVIEGREQFQQDADLVWAALRDPVAYFTWNPEGKLLSPVEQIQDEMHLLVTNVLTGRMTYVHRIESERRRVTLEISMQLRTISLGHEFYRYTVETQPDGRPGCIVHQLVDIHLTTGVGRFFSGLLELEVRRVVQKNYNRLAAFLQTAPALVNGRFPILR
jgi:hypothetical protein